MVSDTQKLLQASIDIIDLQRENERLTAENRLLQSRLDFITLRRIRLARDLPALLKRQAE